MLPNLSMISLAISNEGLDNLIQVPQGYVLSEDLITFVRNKDPGLAEKLLKDAVLIPSGYIIKNDDIIELANYINKLKPLKTENKALQKEIIELKKILKTEREEYKSEIQDLKDTIYEERTSFRTSLKELRDVNVLVQEQNADLEDVNGYYRRDANLTKIVLAVVAVLELSQLLK